MPPTSDIESSLWRTPNANDPGLDPKRLVDKDGYDWTPGQRAYDRKTGRLAQIGLTQQIQLFPTPTDASKGGGSSRGGDRYGETHTLQGMARQGLLNTEIVPTPTVTTGAQTREDPTPGQTGGTSLAGHVKIYPTPKSSPSGPDYARANRPNSGGDDLATAVARENRDILPTPAKRDHRSGRGRQDNGHTPQLQEVVGGMLNPDWVEWLMGFPIGWTDPDCEDPEDQMPGNQHFDIEPDLSRLTSKSPNRTNRLKCLGNAVVPQMAEWIGRIIVAAEEEVTT